MRATSLIGILFSLLYCFLTFSSMAQSGIIQGGAAVKISGAGANTAFQGLDAVYSNAAAMVTNTFKWGLDLGAEQRFGLNELSTYSAAVQYNAKKNSIAISIAKFGFESYNEQKLSFSYGRPLFNNLNIGGNFNFNTIDLADYGNKSTLGFDVSAFSKINEQIAFAFQINNPFTINLTPDYKIPNRMAFAATYSPMNNLSWSVEFEKLSNRETAIKTFVLYNIKSNIQIRTGVDLTRSTFAIGASYKFSDFKIIGANSFNNILGNSPGVNIQYTR